MEQEYLKIKKLFQNLDTSKSELLERFFLPLKKLFRNG
jgi:hypothetical protein